MRASALLAAATLMLTLLTIASAPAFSEVSDTIAIVKDDESPSNAEISVRLSEVTFDAASADTVLLSRDDLFVDAMAGAVLQSDSPLLLVPPSGGLPDRVLEEIERMGASHAVLLGGTAALPDSIADELDSLGLTVDRLAGLSRFETATAIAGLGAPDATTAILARAFPSDDTADETQAFADSIAAGGMSADLGYPILLTETGVLTGATRDYLTSSAVQSVLVVGGTAAISEGVVDQVRDMGIDVERIADDTRAGTAVGIAGKRGIDSAADAARTILVEGQDEDAWAAGFASAAHSAAFDAPIVLADGEDLPPETVAFLSGSGAPAYAQAGPPPSAVLTCATLPAACEEARELLGLPAPLGVTFSPAPGSSVEPGDGVSISLTGDATGVTGASDGSCTAGPAEGTSTAIPTDQAEGTCTVVWSLTHPNGTVQTEQVDYVVEAPVQTAEQPPAPPPAPRPPVAGFDQRSLDPDFARFSQTDPCPTCDNRSVQFNDASTAGDAAIVGWSWDFGDGTESSGATHSDPLHTYTFPGEYTVTLTVTDANGLRSSSTQTILTADFDFFQDGCTTLYHFFDDSDEAVPLTVWTWDFDDGTIETTPDPTIDHEFVQDGTIYTVKMQVENENGAVGIVWNDVTTCPPPPPSP